MYDELVKRLREHNGWALNETLDKAADAIEQLSNAGSAYGRGWTLGYDAGRDDGYDAGRDENMPRWIPVEERLPETGIDVLVKFPHNLAVASRDLGSWVVNSGDGWCTDVNLSDDEREPTHWMPLPEPPKEEKS